MESKRCERTEPEVVRGAAADAEQNEARFFRTGTGHQFTRAERRRFPRVALVPGQEFDAAGGSEADDRQGIFDFGFSIFDWQTGAGGGRNPGLVDVADGRWNISAAWAGDFSQLQPALRGVGQCLSKTLTAVGEWTEVERPVGVLCVQGASRDIAGLTGGECVLELVEGDEAAHAGMEAGLSVPRNGSLAAGNSQDY